MKTGPSASPPAQDAILAIVQLLPGREQREVAAAGYDSVTMSQIIRKLEAIDLVRRDKGNRSRRGHSIRLTAAGAETRAQIAPAIARVQNRLMKRLPAEKRALFCSF